MTIHVTTHHAQQRIFSNRWWRRSAEPTGKGPRRLMLMIPASPLASWADQSSYHCDLYGGGYTLLRICHQGKQRQSFLTNPPTRSARFLSQKSAIGLLPEELSGAVISERVGRSLAVDNLRPGKPLCAKTPNPGAVGDFARALQALIRSPTACGNLSESQR